MAALFPIVVAVRTAPEGREGSRRVAVVTTIVILSRHQWTSCHSSVLRLETLYSLFRQKLDFLCFYEFELLWVQAEEPSMSASKDDWTM